jgi:hypothetical protein
MQKMKDARGTRKEMRVEKTWSIAPRLELRVRPLDIQEPQEVRDGTEIEQER